MSSLLNSGYISTILIVLGGALTLLGAIVSSIESSKDKDELIKRDKQIIELAKENSNLSKESLKQITGGDSWAYMTGGLKAEKGILNQPFGITLNVIGDYPLYDLKVNIQEIELKNDLPDSARHFKNILSEEIGTLNKSLHPYMIGILTLPNKKRVEYLIRLNARNGEIIQHWIFMKKANDHWATATNVSRLKPNSEGGFSKDDLFQKIDNDFPEKNIEWSYY